jgi:hypothetical protein
VLDAQTVVPAISKCTVAAGKTLDTISFSGILNAREADLLAAMGGNVVVTVNSDSMVKPLNSEFPITNTSPKKGKFSGKNPNSSFALDTKTGKMAFSAKNADLTGLACPITVTITIGSYTANLEVKEDVVNGTKLCPLPLLQGVKNSLDITKKPSFKKGKTAGTDSLTVSGTFTVAGEYKKAPLTITVGNQMFPVPIEQVGDKNYVASCKPASKIGPQVTAKLDYNKCTFTISVKNATINLSGDVAFGINCFDVNLQGLETINLN